MSWMVSARTTDFPKEDGTIEKISIANDFVSSSGGGYFFAPTIEVVREVLAESAAFGLGGRLGRCVDFTLN